MAFFGLLSGPLAEAGFKKALADSGVIIASEENFASRAIMVYHIAAVIVMAGTLYLALRHVEFDQRLEAPYTATAGWLIAVPSGLVLPIGALALLPTPAGS